MKKKTRKVRGEKKIKLKPEVRDTYLFILQEFERIERAMNPLKEHLKFLKENGYLTPNQ